MKRLIYIRGEAALVLQAICLLIVMLLTGQSAVVAKEAHIAVAANFNGVAQKLAEEFEKQTPHRVKITSGSSGKIFAKIRYGAPFDLFLSADRVKPAQLITEGLAVANSRLTYAQGVLTLWAGNNNTAESVESRLKNRDFKKLALANPKFAPYGFAAQSVLDNLGLTQSVRNRLVMGENVAQAFLFVKTGNATLGFIAKSQLIAQSIEPTTDAVWVVPSDLYPPINQDMVLLNGAKNNQAALAFWRYLQSSDAQLIIEKNGYLVPTQQHITPSHL